jgi:peptide chain release factor subunit 1
VKALQPRMSRATSETLDRLAKQAWNGGKVLSVYLDLDPSSFATAGARDTQITSLLSEAERLVEDHQGAEKKALRKDLELVRQFLTFEDNWAKNARALAIFCSSRQGLFEVLDVPFRLDSRVSIGSSPLLGPLREDLYPDKWCVLLVNRRTARIFSGAPDSLRQVGEVTDRVHRQHDQGGWSQARYARSVEKSMKDHLTHVAEALFDLQKKRRFDHLAVGAMPELWPEVEARLHSDLLKILAGRIELDVENSSAEEVGEELKKLVAIREHQKEKEMLERLRQEIGTGDRAAAGLEQVLDCLNEARVETLLVAEGFETSGVACPNCGWLAISGSECPLDGSFLEREPDLVSKAAERTISRSGEVHVVRYHPDLQALGSIAALLRF